MDEITFKERIMNRIVMLLMLTLLCMSTLSHAGNGDLTVSGSIGVGTDAPAASAALDITSTTKGFLLPRMTTVQRNAIAAPATATGLLIYNTDENSFNYYTGTTWVSIGTIQGTYSNSGALVFATSGTFTVPAGITKVYVEAWGGGGGGGGSSSGELYNGTSGGTTSFGSLLSATGGGGGGKGISGTGGAGGAGGQGNSLGLNGGAGGTGTCGYYDGEAGISSLSVGGASGTSYLMGAGEGAGGAGGGNDYGCAGGGGGGGGFARAFLAVTPGQQIAVSIGAGGLKAGGAGTQTSGKAGKLIVFW